MAEQYIERYRRPTRILHWIHTGSFIVLFFTGLILFIPGVSILAEDSWTRLIHRIAVVVFVVAPAIYIPMNFKATLRGIKDAFTWGTDDLGWLLAAPRYYMLSDEESMPPQGHMNTGQKMWWFIVIVFGAIFLITGLVMWAGKESAPQALLQWMVFVHDVAFIVTGAMLFVHVYLSVAHPLMKGAFDSMAKGKVSAEYAKSHHGKWYEEMTGGKKAGRH
jgi:formate dehydrogenase subunit gamma